MNLSKIHLVHGFKTSCAAVLAFAVTTVFNLEFGYWAVISAVIVMQIYVADSVEMCLYRLSGTTIGALIGVLVLLVIPKNNPAVGLALFATIGFCSFLTRYRARYRMAAITVAIVIMTGINADNYFVFGLFRVFEIFVGILCAFLVSVLIFPKRRVDVLMQKIKTQAESCAKKNTILVDAFVARQQNVEENLVDGLVKDVWNNHELLQKINQHEGFIYQKKINLHLPEKVSVMNRSAEHLRNMVRTLNGLDENGYDIILEKELKALAEESGKTLVRIMETSSKPEFKILEEQIQRLDAGLLNLREKGLIRRFDSKRLVQVFSFYSSLLYFSEDILAAAKKIGEKSKGV